MFGTILFPDTNDVLKMALRIHECQVCSFVSGHFDGEDISKAKDEGIMKRIKENGEGFDHPNVSSRVTTTSRAAHK
jgi:hypothetical protein